MLDNHRQNLADVVDPVPGDSQPGQTSSSVTPTPHSRASSRRSALSSHHRRASRNSINPPTEDNATPLMLRFYPSEWQVILKDAKNLYRSWLALSGPYPPPLGGHKEAHDTILEAIADFKTEGGVINKSLSCQLFLYMLSQCL